MPSAARFGFSFLLFIGLCLFSVAGWLKNEPVISRYDIANCKELDAGQLGGTDRNPYFDITQSLFPFPHLTIPEYPSRNGNTP